MKATFAIGQSVYVNGELGKIVAYNSDNKLPYVIYRSHSDSFTFATESQIKPYYHSQPTKDYHTLNELLEIDFTMEMSRKRFSGDDITLQDFTRILAHYFGTSEKYYGDIIPKKITSPRQPTKGELLVQGFDCFRQVLSDFGKYTLKRGRQTSNLTTFDFYISYDLGKQIWNNCVKICKDENGYYFEMTTLRFMHAVKYHPDFIRNRDFDPPEYICSAILNG